MVEPKTCFRCAQPLTIGSIDGLCPTCAEFVNTPAVSVARLEPKPEAGEQEQSASDDQLTATYCEPSASGITATAPAAVVAPPLSNTPTLPLGYEYIRTLGSGGMGDVYLARDVTADRLVAIKFLHAPGRSTALERFTNEVRALARLNHPNIVRVLGHDFLRADPYFTMEHAPGGSLAQRVAREGPLSPPEAARILAVIARAAHAAHQTNILHRDIKPSNILLAADGTPWLSDFGLSKRTDLDDDLTTGSGPLGTLCYMPPEQARRGPLDARADVYGLGATLYHLLTGRPPFPNQGPETLRYVLESPPTRPRNLRPEIPRELEAICLKCLEKKPDHRYPSALALAEDLERFLAGRTPSAPPLTRWRLAGRWVRRRAPSMALTVVTLLAAAGLLAAGKRLAPVPHEVRDTPSEEYRRIQARLDAGQPAVLVGETGGPRWHRWHLGASTFGVAPNLERCCYFQTPDHVLLELLDDPRTDRYTVSAEVRLFGVPGLSPDGYCGLYFGRQSNPDPFSQEFCYAVVFRDFTKAAKMPPGSAQLRVMETLWKQRDDSSFLVPNSVQFVGIELPLLQARPGPWRRITARVTPDLIQVLWAETLDQNDQEVARLERRDGTFLQVVPSKPDRPFRQRQQPVGWSPRSPLGIWALNSSVGVRNVVVTPDPRR